MTVFVVAIVEGHTETAALERLLQRIWSQLGRTERLQVVDFVRSPRNQLVSLNGIPLTEAIQKAVIKLAPHLRRNPGCESLLLIDIDADKDCPAELGPKLFEVAKVIRSDLNIACVLANREFENWIVAGSSTLGGVLGLPDSIPVRFDVEAMKGSSWLDQQLRSVTANSKYKKADHALEFVKAMDILEARTNSKSFDRLCKKLNQIPLPQVPPPSSESEELSAF